MFWTLSVRDNFANGIFDKVYKENIINYHVSGSSKQYINGTKQVTKPEYAIYPWEKKYDWCSNCARSYDNMPYITFSLTNKLFKFNSYYIKCGCCDNDCCCDDDYYNYCFDCCLYSWTLQISDDNKTWKNVHKVDSDATMIRCAEKSYELESTYTARYVRLIQDRPCPGYPPCIALNRFEFFGDAVNSS